MKEQSEPWWPHLSPEDQAEFMRVSQGLDELSERFETRRRLREKARSKMKREQERAK